MYCSSLRAIVVAALFAFLVGCSGGSVAPRPLTAKQTNPNPGIPAVGITSYAFSPAGGSYALPLPQGYDGAITFGANHSPPGGKLRLSVDGGLVSEAAGRIQPLSVTTPHDPFPIAIGVELPFTITIQVPSFTIHFPRRLHISGTFDVDWFDPTQVENPPLNPRQLGIAVASGNTLTFTPPADETLTIVADVQYTLSILRDVSNAYPNGANSVLLPVQSNVQEELATVGPLGAGVNYQASSNNGFLLWQTINGGPNGIAPNIFNDNPLESLVVSATQALALNSATITAEFNVGGSFAMQRTPAAVLRPLTSNSASSPPSGAFVPDANPQVFGPFPATLNGHSVIFTATKPGGFRLGGGKAWDFSVVTVTVCAPLDTQQTCDSPNSTNVRTTVGLNTQFDVLVSDASGLLTNAYGLSATPPCSTAGLNQSDNSTDVPPGYNDNPTGPNAEFEVATGDATGTCTIAATYNGGQVATTTIQVGSSSSAIRRPYTLRPPVNGPTGFGISGSIH